MGDNNIQKPTQVRPCMQPSNWRSRIDPRSRQKVIAKIIGSLRRQSTEPEQLSEVEKFARSFEEKVFAVALNQQDYLKRIVSKLMALEGRAQSGVANSPMPYPASSVPNPLHSATRNVQSQDSSHSQMPLQTISPPQPHSQAQPHQIISSKTPMSNSGFSSVSSSVAAVGRVIQAPGSNFTCQSSNASNISRIQPNLKRNSPDQCVPSNPVAISRAQEQQRQHIQQPVFKNYDKQFLEEHQARNQVPNQKTSHGNIALNKGRNSEQPVYHISQPASKQQHGSFQDIPVQRKVTALEQKATGQQSSSSCSSINRPSQSHSLQQHSLQPTRVHSLNPQRPGAQSIPHHGQQNQKQHGVPLVLKCDNNTGVQKASSGFLTSQWVESQEKMISQGVTEKKKPSSYASFEPQSLRPVAGRGESGTLGSLEVAKTSEASSYGVKHVVVEAWRENAYKKIMAMRSRYMSKLEEIHYMLNAKSKQLSLQGEHSNKGQFEKLKENNRIVERIFRLLSIPKDKLVPSHEERLDDWDKKIVCYLSKWFKARNTSASLQQEKQFINQHERVKTEPPDLPQTNHPDLHHPKETQITISCAPSLLTNNHQEKQPSSLPLVISPGISPSPLLSECHNENNLIAQTPIQRLVNSVSAISHHALKSSVDDIYSVMSLVDGLEASAPKRRSRSSLGQDLAGTTWCRMQARSSRIGETKRYISLVPREMWNDPEKPDQEPTTENPRKIPRIEAYSYSNKLREEIEDVNQKLIDTQVNICEEKDMNLASSGIVIKCLFNGVSLNPGFFKSLIGCSGNSSTISVQPLHLLVPTDYPKCSPILLDEFSSEIGDAFLDISSKARSKLGTFLRGFKDPITISEIARTWEVCAREVIIELAEKFGGGNFSSRYGTWENCLGAV